MRIASIRSEIAVANRNFGVKQFQFSAAQVRQFPEEIGYTYFDETDNALCKLFLG